MEEEGFLLKCHLNRVRDTMHHHGQPTWHGSSKPRRYLSFLYPPPPRRRSLAFLNYTAAATDDRPKLNGQCFPAAPRPQSLLLSQISFRFSPTSHERAHGGVRWEGGAKAAPDRGAAVRGDRALERAGHPRDKIDIKYKLVHEYSSRVVPNGSGFLDEV